MLRTAEWVSPKHPDKMCDRIADLIVQECLRQDPESRCAIEVMGGHGIVTITGELTTKAYVDIAEIPALITGQRLGVQVNVVKQSPEIARGVDVGGAGDQGIMVGYACDDNDDMVPRELFLARKLGMYLWNNIGAHDGKTQVTIDEEGKVQTVVISWAKTEKEKILDALIDWWQNAFEEFKLDSIESVEVHVNPCGDWYLSGFDADTGLTGRKIAVDSYGPNIPVGGGAFSGKDPSKVDRSGAYAARAVAVQLLKLEKAKEVYVYLAYAIGKEHPVQAVARIHYGGKEPYSIDKALPLEVFTPKNIIEKLKLRDHIEVDYQMVAAFGHFGTLMTWNGAVDLLPC